MKKKFKKVTIALIVLLMVIAGTLAWLVTSDFKKGKIGAANFTLDVEAVRPIETTDFDDEDFVFSSDGFTANDGELAYQEAIDGDEDTTTIFHYEDKNMYPISKTNINAIYDEDKVATKYIRITNNNDSDAIVEVSAYSDDTMPTVKASDNDDRMKSTLNILGMDDNVSDDEVDKSEEVEKLEAVLSDKLVLNEKASVASATSRLAGVSWLVGAPDGFDTYLGSSLKATTVEKTGALANILNNKAADIDEDSNLIDADDLYDEFSPEWIRGNDGYFADNDFFTLVGIGYSKDIREAAWGINDDDPDDVFAYPLIDYDNYEDGADVNSLMQRNVVYVEDGSRIAGLNSEKALLADKASLANILKDDGNQVAGQEGGDGSGDSSGTQAPALRELNEKAAPKYLAENIEGQYIHQTFEDASTTGFALPFVLRAHTSVVIPFKVFLNENWTEELGSFTYEIDVNARNYTSGDDITFQSEKKTTELSSTGEIYLEQTHLIISALSDASIFDFTDTDVNGNVVHIADLTVDQFRKHMLAKIDAADGEEATVMMALATNVNSMVNQVMDAIAIRDDVSLETLQKELFMKVGLTEEVASNCANGFSTGYINNFLNTKQLDSLMRNIVSCNPGEVKVTFDNTQIKSGLKKTITQTNS